jgi:hypothetical protein
MHDELRKILDNCREKAQACEYGRVRMNCPALLPISGLSRWAQSEGECTSVKVQDAIKILLPVVKAARRRHDAYQPGPGAEYIKRLDAAIKVAEEAIAERG